MGLSSLLKRKPPSCTRRGFRYCSTMRGGLSHNITIAVGVAKGSLPAIRLKPTVGVSYLKYLRERFALYYNTKRRYKKLQTNASFFT